MEGFVVEVEVAAGFDHIAHHATKPQTTASLLLLALRRQFPVPRLDALLLHRERPIHVVQLVVEAARVADWLSGLIPSPERGGRGLAVGTAGARPPRRTLQRQPSFRLDERSVLAVHLVVEAASVAEVVTGTVSSPQWRRCRAAIHAFAALYRKNTVETTNSINLAIFRLYILGQAFNDTDRTADKTNSSSIKIY